MVHLVASDNRNLYRAELAAMHRDRKRASADEKISRLSIADGRLGVDRFDTDNAVYLIDIDPSTRRYLGSIRVLPSTKPHILGTLLPDLCADDVPIGDDIWEITQVRAAQGLENRELSGVHRRLTVALVEFGLLHGIGRYTCVTSLHRLSGILSVGWECEPLGLPKEIEGILLSALSISVSPSTLQMFLIRNRSLLPVLQIGHSPASVIAAA